MLKSHALNILNTTDTDSPFLFRLNEAFGPTIQGEGIEQGKPCFFIRTHGCPVQCPGCDTHYTWDGSEPGERVTWDDLEQTVSKFLESYPGTGCVVSGGEPLIHYRNDRWLDFLAMLNGEVEWVSLETSGFITPKPEGFVESDLVAHLRLFTSVHLSPKITPCLRGRWSDDEMLITLATFLEAFEHRPQDLAFKFVVRDEHDLAVVDDYVESHVPLLRGHRIFLMPYGTSTAEVAGGCRWLVPHLATRGWELSPRLHCLLWGSERLA